MTVSEALHSVYLRRKGRSADDVLASWCVLFAEVFDLAHFIVADRDLAKAIAFDVIEAFDEERPKRRHRAINALWYHAGRTASKLRKPALTDDQTLDLLVLRCSTSAEKKKEERGDASLDDRDVWFIKCLIEQSYWSGERSRPSALWLAVAITAVLHDFDIEHEVPHIWYALTRLVPRGQELHADGSEPFRAHWSALIKAVRRRFGDLVVKNGRSDIRRRRPDQHAHQIIARSLERFELHGSRNRCLALNPHSGNDTQAETTRLHALTHQQCFERTLSGLPLHSRSNRTTLPEFTVMNNLDRGDPTRRPPSLTSSEWDDVREHIRARLHNRKTACLSHLSVVVEDDEDREVHQELMRHGKVVVNLPENARLLRIRARIGEGIVLLASRVLSPLATMPDLYLDDGRVITFSLSEPGLSLGGVECEIEVKEPWGILANLATRSLVARLSQPSSGRAAAAAAVSVVVFISIAVLTTRPAPSPDLRTSPRAEQTGAVAENPGARAGAAASTHPLPDASPAVPSRIAADRPKPRARASAPVSQAALPRLHIEPFDIYSTAELNRKAQQREVDALHQAGTFRIVSSAEQADAKIEVVADFRTAGLQPVQFRITLARSREIIWSRTVHISGDTSGEGFRRDGAALHTALAAAVARAQLAIQP
jgi:hypothetical protein